MLDISPHTHKDLEKKVIADMIYSMLKDQKKLSEKHKNPRFELYLKDFVELLVSHFSNLDRNPKYLDMGKNH